jgi:hypothetical protein
MRIANCATIANASELMTLCHFEIEMGCCPSRQKLKPTHEEHKITESFAEYEVKLIVPDPDAGCFSLPKGGFLMISFIYN